MTSCTDSPVNTGRPADDGFTRHDEDDVLRFELQQHDGVEGHGQLTAQLPVLAEVLHLHVHQYVVIDAEDHFN